MSVRVVHVVGLRGTSANATRRTAIRYLPGVAQGVRRGPDIVREFFGGDKALAQVIAAVVAHFASAIVAVLDVGANIPGTHGARLVSLGGKGHFHGQPIQ